MRTRMIAAFSVFLIAATCVILITQVSEIPESEGATSSELVSFGQDSGKNVSVMVFRDKSFWVVAKEGKSIDGTYSASLTVDGSSYNGSISISGGSFSGTLSDTFNASFSSSSAFKSMTWKIGNYSVTTNYQYISNNFAYISGVMLYPNNTNYTSWNTGGFYPVSSASGCKVYSPSFSDNGYLHYDQTYDFSSTSTSTWPTGTAYKFKEVVEQAANAERIPVGISFSKDGSTGTVPLGDVTLKQLAQLDFGMLTQNPDIDLVLYVVWERLSYSAKIWNGTQYQQAEATGSGITIDSSSGTKAWTSGEFSTDESLTLTLAGSSGGEVTKEIQSVTVLNDSDQELKIVTKISDNAFLIKSPNQNVKIKVTLGEASASLATELYMTECSTKSIVINFHARQDVSTGTLELTGTAYKQNGDIRIYRELDSSVIKSISATKDGTSISGVTLSTRTIVGLSDQADYIITIVPIDEWNIYVGKADLTIGTLEIITPWQLAT